MAEAFFLLIMVLVVPAAMTAGSYVGAEYMLVETHRFIAPANDATGHHR